MRTLVCLIFASVFVFALEVEDVKKFYENQEYEKICTDEVANFYTKWHDEGLTNMYAHSCLNLDMLNRLIIPIVQLHKSESSRANASYYATVLTQKKLLYYSLIDNIDISYVRLPKTGYILSNIFERYTKKEYEKDGDVFIFNEKNDIVYKLSLTKNGNTIKMVLKTYQNDTLMKTRYYW